MMKRLKVTLSFIKNFPKFFLKNLEMLAGVIGVTIGNCFFNPPAAIITGSMVIICPLLLYVILCFVRNRKVFYVGDVVKFQATTVNLVNNELVYGKTKRVMGQILDRKIVKGCTEFVYMIEGLKQLETIYQRLKLIDGKYTTREDLTLCDEREALLYHTYGPYVLEELERSDAHHAQRAGTER